MTRRAVTALVLAAMLPVAAAAQDADTAGDLPPGVVRGLEERGFAVDTSSAAGLVRTYRFPGPDAVCGTAHAPSWAFDVKTPAPGDER